MKYEVAEHMLQLTDDEGVWRPTVFGCTLAHHVSDETTAADYVLDLGTGSGVLAIAACLAGARSVTALDLNERAVARTQDNAVLNGCCIRVLRSHMFSSLPECERNTYTLLAANPPTFPVEPPRHKNLADKYAWEKAGEKGRAVLDPLIAQGRRWLRSDGRMLFVTSSTQDWGLTCEMLARHGWQYTILAEKEIPLAAHYEQFIPLWRSMQFVDEPPITQHHGSLCHTLRFVKAWPC